MSEQWKNQGDAGMADQQRDQADVSVAWQWNGDAPRRGAREMDGQHGEGRAAPQGTGRRRRPALRRLNTPALRIVGLALALVTLLVGVTTPLLVAQRQTFALPAKSRATHAPTPTVAPRHDGPSPLIVLPPSLLHDAAYQAAATDVSNALSLVFAQPRVVTTPLSTATATASAVGAKVATPTPAPTASAGAHDAALLTPGSVVVTEVEPAANQRLDIANTQLPTPTLADGGNALAATLDPSLAQALGRLTMDGYVVRGVAVPGGQATIVAGVGVRGPLYGLFRLAQLYRADPAHIGQQITLDVSPAMPLRMVSFNLSGLSKDQFEAQAIEELRAGYNAVMVENWASVADFHDVDPRIYDAGKFPQEAKWVADHRQRMRDELDVAQQLHMLTFSIADVVTLPRSVVSLFGAQVGANPSMQLPPSRSDDFVSVSPPVFCYTAPKTQELVNAEVGEALHDFPTLDIFEVRVGESYALGPLLSSQPSRGSCPATTTAASQARTAATVEQMYHAIVANGHKLYIHRAWDIGANGFHADPNFATQIYNDLSSAHLPHDGLVMSFKQTQADFWRYAAFNPNIGKGPYSQAMEIQSGREYEGKGSIPNYTGPMVAQGDSTVSPAGGLAQAQKDGVRSISVWDGGGGWNGPNLRLPVWVRLNTYAAGRLAWDPQSDPQRIAYEWAANTFGYDAAGPITDLLMRSATVILDAWYIGPWAQSRGDWGDVVTFRDDDLTGAQLLPRITTWVAQHDKTDDALREKQQARDALATIVSDEQQAEPHIADPALRSFLSDTIHYEQMLVTLLCDYTSGALVFARWQNQAGHGKSDAADHDAAKQDLIEAQADWKLYQNATRYLAYAATPYRDEGMTAYISQMLSQLG